MTIRFNTLVDLTVSTAVQYLSDVLEVFDGVQQYVRGRLSNTTGSYFVYGMLGYKSLMVSIRSLSDTKYRIVGKLATWRDYLSSTNLEVFPPYSNDADD